MDLQEGGEGRNGRQERETESSNEGAGHSVGKGNRQQCWVQEAGQEKEEAVQVW